MPRLILANLVTALAVVAGAGCVTHQPALATTAPRPAAKPSSAVRALQSQLDAVFNAPIMAHAAWGVDVRSLDRGDVLFSLNADKLAMPASNMKILTLAAAAQVLGWDFRFATVLETSAAVENGVLRGDLIIRGNGDPTISTRGNRGQAVFDEWAAALRAAGITSIHGRIVADDQAFDDEGVGPGWSWDYLEAGYAAPVGALQYNENTADLTVAAGAVPGDPAIVELAPGSGLVVVNRAVTGEPSPSGSRGAIDVRRRIDRPELEISGTIPAGAPVIRRTVAVINPTLFFVESARNALVARGIDVVGAAVDGDEIAAELPGGSERRVLATTMSPPLREMAGVLMKVSQNQYAETFLKAAGATRGGLGTTAAGRRVAAETFTAWGIPATTYVMSDGSGLSRYNYIAPSTITAILARMYADPVHRDAFVSTLPVAGRDGTLSTRMRRSPAEGNAAAKTGSIANVRSLSGYVRTRGGGDDEVVGDDGEDEGFAATVNWITDLAVEILANASR